MLHQWDETSLVVRLSGSTGLIERSIYIEVSKREQVCCNYINIELAYETSASASLSTVSPAAPSPVLPAKSSILPTLNSSAQSEAIFFEMGHCELFVQPFAYLSLSSPPSVLDSPSLCSSYVGTPFFTQRT